MIRFAVGAGVVAGCLSIAVGCSDRGDSTIGSGETATSSDKDSGAGSNDAHNDGRGGHDSGASPTTTEDSGSTTPSGPVCSSAFGTALTAEYGRADGKLVGIARPQDTHCSQPNSTHVALDVQINGAPYRFLVNVQSDTGSPDVYFSEATKKLPGLAFGEGWHTASADDIYLDYPSYLGVHTADLATSYPLADLTDKIVSELTIGDNISVYATGYGDDGGHDIHKEGTFGTDGAVVIGPDTASPKWLLFRFDDSVAF